MKHTHAVVMVANAAPWSMTESMALIRARIKSAPLFSPSRAEVALPRHRMTAPNEDWVECICDRIDVQVATASDLQALFGRAKMLGLEVDLQMSEDAGQEPRPLALSIGPADTALMRKLTAALSPLHIPEEHFED